VSRLNDWWTTLRTANLPTVWSNVILGVGLSAPTVSAELLAPMFALMLGISLIYLAGMALNDGMDVAFDRAAGSNRAVAAGRIPSQLACTVGAALLLFGIIVIAIGATLNSTPASTQAWILVTALLASAVVMYNVTHRRSHWLAAILMAVCRACVPILAALLTINSVLPSVWVAACAVGIWTIGVTLIGRGERGGEPLVCGGIWWLVVAGLASLPVVWMTTSGRWDGAAAGLLITLVAWIPPVARMIRAGDRSGAVCWAIAGLAILDCSLLLSAGHIVWASASIVLGAVTLGAQRIGRGS